MAMLIFSQKINMDGHADFSLKKSTLMAMLFFLKKLTWMAMLIFTQKISMEGHADFP